MFSPAVSSVARGAPAPPLACEVCKIARFWCFWGRFFVKNWKYPPHRKTAPPQTFGFPKLAEKSVSISVKTFFFFFGDHLILGGKNVRISDFGRKISLNFGEDLFFFGDHLILGGKNLWISELSEKFRLNFRTNRVKVIQEQWKFGSRSFALFSLFQNSPPPFSKSWLRACLQS